MLRFAIGLVLLASLGNIQAGPGFWVSGQVIRQVDDCWDVQYDTTGKEISRWAYRDPYWGLGCRLEYGPVSLFRFHLDIAELRLFSAGGGAVAAFPTVGLNVSVEPPFNWRVLPCLWMGGSYTGYFGWQDTTRIDPRFGFGRDYRLRAGVGARASLTRRLELYAETDIWRRETHQALDPIGATETLLNGGFSTFMLGVAWSFGQ